MKKKKININNLSHYIDMIAGLIIDGLYNFKKVAKVLREAVANRLKEKGYEHLATDSEAKEDEEK